MPAAANLLKSIAGDAAPTAAPRPGGEAFATMMNVEEATPPESPAAVGAEAVDVDATPQPALDLIAPLLAQQQVVPTVIVPQAGTHGAAVAAEGQGDSAKIPTTDCVSAEAPSPVPGEVEGASIQLAQAAGSGIANSTATAPTTGRADAPRLRSGRAEDVGAAIPIEVGVKAQTAGTAEAVAVPDLIAEKSVAGTVTAQVQAKAPNTGTQAQPTISAAAAAATPDAANDRQPGSGERPAETALPSTDIPTQQASTSFTLTDARALLASLTSVAGLSTAAAAQAGPAQQLGEALAAQVLDLAGGSEWLEQLSREIGRTADGSGPLRFRLTPESLGELRVEISQSDRGAIVRMSVATEAAQAALTDAQPRLAAEARAQGVRIAETHVDLTGGQQQHEREQGRHPAAPADQPLRAFRGAGSTRSSAEPASSRPADRYA